MSGYKFKIGDKVRFKSKDSLNAGFFGEILENLEIKEIDENELHIWMFDKSDWFFVRFEEVEIIGDVNHFKETCNYLDKKIWESIMEEEKNIKYYDEALNINEDIIKKMLGNITDNLTYNTEGKIILTSTPLGHSLFREILKGGKNKVDLNGYPCGNIIFEEVKDFTKSNLAEGKADVLEERKSLEIKQASLVYESLLNDKEAIDRQVKQLGEELKKINEKLKIFNK